MRFRHLAEQIYFRPWFITPAAHRAIALVFERALNDPAVATQLTALDGQLSDLFPQRKSLVIDSEGIATIHLLGPLGKGLSKMEQSCGATSFESIRADYEAAVAAHARGCILHIDSPGGTVTGTPEIAALIADGPLPCVAYTEDMIASAAYYIAAGARAIVASPSASVGSIGVYIPWVDSSAQYAAAGLKPDPIVNTGGDLKALGFGGSLSPVQREHLQEQVDADFGLFRAHVLAHRTLADSAMRGQVMSGPAALSANLIDAIGDMSTARALLSPYLRLG